MNLVLNKTALKGLHLLASCLLAMVGPKALNSSTHELHQGENFSSKILIVEHRAKTGACNTGCFIAQLKNVCSAAAKDTKKLHSFSRAGGEAKRHVCQLIVA